jgi:hypothetical protein
VPITKKLIHCALLETQAKKQSDIPVNASVLDGCITTYQTYVDKIGVAVAENDFYSIAETLNSYLNFAKGLEATVKFLGPRSKYYSSILEEFPVLLCADIVTDLYACTPAAKGNAFILGDAECSIRIGASPSGAKFCETKRIDFSLAMYSESLKANVPLLGYEIKKYMDKTMFGTVLETYKALQIFRPRTVYGFIVEDEARDAAVQLNSPMYRDEFVLTGSNRSDSSRNQIRGDVLERFNNHLTTAIKDAFASLSIASPPKPAAPAVI